MQKKRGVSLKFIAQQAGVSTSLVSFVLNGKQQQYRINDQVAQRVKDIAKQYDYKPNGFAKSLRSGCSKTIGVIVSDISNQFFSNMARQIEVVTEENGYMTLFASSDESAAKTSALVDKMLAKEVDGIILVPCEGSDDTVHYLVGQGVPLVLVDRTIPDCKTNSVCLNNFQATYQATCHLLSEGYKKIAFVAYDTPQSHMEGRINGYKQAMADAGKSSEEIVRFVDAANMSKSCGKVVSEQLSNGVDSMIFATNTIAVNCLYHIQEKGVKVPTEMGLVGFDSDTAFDFFYSPLTCVQQPIELIARKAVGILLDNIAENSGMCQQVETSAKLVIRASSQRKNDK